MTSTPEEIRHLMDEASTPMRRYTFEAPAVVCFEVDAKSEEEALEKARKAHIVLLNADQPAPYPGNESPAHEARFWTVGTDEGLELRDSVDVDNT